MIDEAFVQAVAANVVAGLDEEGDPVASLGAIRALLKATFPGYVEDILSGNLDYFESVEVTPTAEEL